MILQFRNIFRRNTVPESILFFTTHKSASMFIYSVCKELSEKAGLNYLSSNESIDRRDIDDPANWIEDGACIAPVRAMPRGIDSSVLDNYKIILHLRDPRDVLTSMFFSYCFIHSGEEAVNTGMRKEVSEKGIDAFVIKVSTDKVPIMLYGTGDETTILSRYQDYISMLLGRKNVTLVHYEEMVSDFRSWITRVSQPFILKDSTKVIDALCLKYEGSFKPRSVQNGEEVLLDHKRKVTPGDYLDKLKPETIEKLNTIYKDILEKLGYKI